MKLGPALMTFVLSSLGSGDANDVSSLMDINTIINGGTAEDGTEFPGLIPLINSYMATIEDADVDTRCTISQYLKLLSDRASGMS